ncbi:ankyrin repeat protein [Cotonvirus japonicus]|uniref:Ankyrin repeat protein n=1 Tax=Cotonvirus japonicus TaxID=2811091 RepID=A0ABM7NS24_9VIRU|nr:ankyrin repeat protein [Cotonvirus japonicus]BCS82960.1 ankyrin repeat protein [Cotonvirus japonicus]
MDQFNQHIKNNNTQFFLNINNSIIFDNKYKILRSSIYYDKPDIFLCIFKIKDIKFNEKCLNWLLFYAIILNRVDIVSKMIQLNFNIDISNNFALYISCCNGYFDMTKLLFNNCQDKTLLDYNNLVLFSASNGHNKIIDFLLLNCHYNMSFNSHQILYWVFLNGHYNTINFLNSKGFDTSVLDDMDNSCSTKFIVSFEADEYNFYNVRTSIKNNIFINCKKDVCEFNGL